MGEWRVIWLIFSFIWAETDCAEAESWLQAAILSHEQLGMKWDLASDYMIFAQFLKLQGRACRGEGLFDKSLTLFNDCGAEGWCRRIETAQQTG